jgi:hypothetical protein
MLRTLWLAFMLHWTRGWEWLMDHVYGVDE